MAAYAALVSAARTLDEYCSDINNVRDGGLDHRKEEVDFIFKSLLQHFNFLKAFLEDFPVEGEKLEGRIRDVACQSEDLIEDFMLKLQQQIGSDQTEESCNHFHDVFIQELQKVTQEVHSIEGEVVKIKNLTTSSKLAHAPPTSSTAKDDVVMVGFDDQLMAIKERLCGHSTKLHVIPISGMGGIGKTTLARNAFDDQLIKEQFQLRAWVTVSQAYSVREIFLSLLVSCNVLKEKTSSNDEISVDWLKELMYKSLKGRRYVIVVDDVWSTEAWDEVRRVFPEDNNGSRVLLTTRLSEVADYAAAGGGGSDILIHSMGFLDADQSWNLLQEKVFSSSYPPASYDEALEDIGREIARQCGGLPLTIVVVAGILQNVSRTRTAWEEIAQRVNAVAVAESSRDERVGNVLSLSYRHLPHHLRPCLLYMAAGFPEDYKMNASELSKIWTAEGFIKRPASTSSATSSSAKNFAEEMANEYLEDLVKRNLVLVLKRNISGKIISCSVHDLLRDMCIRKAREEQFLQRDDDQHSMETFYKKHQRRVSMNNDSVPLYNRISTDYPTTIHTILSFQKIYNNTSESDAYNYTSFFAATRLLRVFHAPYLSFKAEFPTAHLFHLRYLLLRDLYNQQNRALLEDIYKLKKLQTLVVNFAHLKVPFNIWRMPQLSHLDVQRLYLRPSDAETTLSTLENLQTLSRVCNLVCTETIMMSMPNLKKLSLNYSSDSADVSEFQMENLVHLRQLESLSLDGYLASSLEKLVLPNKLRKLSLCNGMLEWEKLGSISSSLPCLQELVLVCNACCGHIWETKQGQFPQLKKLALIYLNLRQWITESYDHFPSLEHLKLCGCDNLFEIPDGIGDITTLQLIKIENCSESLMESARRIKLHQQDMGNDDLQLQI